MEQCGFLIENGILINVFERYYIDGIQQYEIGHSDDLSLITASKVSFRIISKRDNIDISKFDNDFNLKLDEGLNTTY